MKKSGIFLAAASAVIIFCAAARAGENQVLALNTAGKPAAEVIKTGLQAQATVQAAVPCPDSCDYDALSAVNDPLYRESSKEFLQQVAKEDPAVKKEAAAPAVKPALRDAPNSGVRPAAVQAQPAAHPAIKRPVKKTGPADPVKVKNTL
jgi:hypothetical protein